MSTLERAVQIAAKAHAGQIDKAGHPYLLHPLRVMLRLTTPQERIVGVLHDVVEDAAVTFEDLRAEGFTDEVLDALASVTKRKGEDYMDFVSRAGANAIGLRVKLADLHDNCDLSRISDPQPRDFERVRKYRAAIEALITMTGPYEAATS